MNNFKKLFTTAALTGIIILGATNAQAGLLMSDFNKKADTRPCAEKTQKTRSGSYNLPDFGFIVSGFGFIVSGLTGIIIADSAKQAPTDCGFTAKDNGLLMSD